MMKIVITVDGGVANYNCDAGIEVLILDMDNLRDGEVLTSSDIAGFEHLIDDYYMDYIQEDSLTFAIIPYDDYEKTNGTCGRGTIETTYDKLVELFGEPYQTNCGKTQVEWRIEWSDGIISTIYDWKHYSDPLDITEWSVGGNSPLSIEYIKGLIYK